MPEENSSILDSKIQQRYKHRTIQNSYIVVIHVIINDSHESQINNN